MITSSGIEACNLLHSMFSHKVTRNWCDVLQRDAMYHHLLKLPRQTRNLEKAPSLTSFVLEKAFWNLVPYKLETLERNSSSPGIAEDYTGLCTAKTKPFITHELLQQSHTLHGCCLVHLIPKPGIVQRTGLQATGLKVSQGFKSES